MSDSINALTVVLERDIRDDDCEELINAIRMVRGVMSVEPRVSDVSDHVAKVRATAEIRDKIYELLKTLQY